MKTILIADEDGRLVNLIRLMFTGHKGYRVFAVSDGTDAVLKAKEIIPDIVIVDVSLSNQNGHRVLREIKNDPSLENTSVVLLSSAFMASEKRRAFEDHADEVIMKPFEPEELIEKVERLLNRHEKKQVRFGSSISNEEFSKDDNNSQKAFDKELAEREASGYSQSFKIYSALAYENFFALLFRTVFQRFAELLNRSYRALNRYAEGFGSATGKLKGKVFLNTAFSEALEFISAKRYSRIPLITLALILSISMLIVFADEKYKDVFSIPAVSKSPAPTSTADSAFPALNTSLGILLAGDKTLQEISEVSESGTEDAESKEVTKKKEGAGNSKFERNKGQEELKKLSEKKDASKITTASKGELKGGKYIVTRGDTLSDIANRFNTSTRNIRIVNNIRGDRIYAGTVLIIPKGVVRREITRWDVVETGVDGDSTGIKVIDWSFYVPWSGVAVIHHVFIENASDIDYKGVKVKLYYYPDSPGKAGRGEITATLPVNVPRNSKKVYLKEGFVLRGNFGGMNVKNGDVEIVEAIPDGGALGYSRR